MHACAVCMYSILGADDDPSYGTVLYSFKGNKGIALLESGGLE
jgi:hypothetical protein